MKVLRNYFNFPRKQVIVHKSIIKSFILHMYLLFLFGFFIIIDVLFSNEVSFNVLIGFWSLNELFQKIQRQNSEQRIEEKFS